MSGGAALGTGAMLGLLAALTACHPFGCGTDKCVVDHEYDLARHCYAVFASADELMPWASIKDQDFYYAVIPRNASTTRYGGALQAGRAAGHRREAVIADLERAKIAYLGQRPRSGTLTHEQFKPLFNDANECQNGVDD